jgi:hypothetical protein
VITIPVLSRNFVAVVAAVIPITTRIMITGASIVSVPPRIMIPHAVILSGISIARPSIITVSCAAIVPVPKTIISVAISGTVISILVPATMETIVLMFSAASVAKPVFPIPIRDIAPEVLAITVQLTFIIANVPAVLADVAIQGTVRSDIPAQVFAIAPQLTLIIADRLSVLANISLTGAIAEVAAQIFAVSCQLAFVAADLAPVLANVAIQSAVGPDITAQIFAITGQATLVVADFTSIFPEVVKSAASVECPLIHPSGTLGDFVGPHALEPMDTIGQLLPLNPLLCPAANYLTEAIGEWRTTVHAAHAGAVQSAEPLHNRSQIPARLGDTTQSRRYRRKFLTSEGSREGKERSDC